MNSGGKKAIVVSAGVVVAAVAADPAVRAEFRRLRRFSRRLDAAASGPPVPPPLPPGRIVSVPKVGELFVRDTGVSERPVVILLHGWGATADVNFFGAYPALSDAYRVIALDHRGHGRGLRSSTDFTLEDCADDAAALLGELGVERAIVVGYSMGGPIALLLAHRHPERVAGLVLEATALEFHDAPRERALWLGLNLVEALLRHGAGDGVVQRVLREAISQQPRLDPYRAWIAGDFRRGNIHDIVQAGRALSRYDARSFTHFINIPAVVVLTTLDQLVAPRKQRALAAALGATVFELIGDHDVPIVEAETYGTVTRSAVDLVGLQAGLKDIESSASKRYRPVSRPASERHPRGSSR